MENLVENLIDRNLRLSEAQLSKLQIHCDLLVKWQTVHNLSSIKQERAIYLNHYIDSILGLQALELPESKQIYDLGSGAGFPGIIASILWPDKKIYLVEASSKKCSFLKMAILKMGLKQVEVLDQRVESLKNIEHVISRAAFSFENLNIISGSLMKNAKITLWLSGKNNMDILKTYPWALEKQVKYELEPGNVRQVAIFRNK